MEKTMKIRKRCKIMKNISLKRIIALMCSLVVLFAMFSINVISTAADTTSTSTFGTYTTGTLDKQG